MHQMRLDHTEYCSPSVVMIHQSDCMGHEDDNGIPLVRFDKTDNIPTWEQMIESMERGLVRARYELGQILLSEGRESEAAHLLMLVNEWKEKNEQKIKEISLQGDKPLSKEDEHG